jgi:hypothetical protein
LDGTQITAFAVMTECLRLMRDSQQSRTPVNIVINWQHHKLWL